MPRSKTRRPAARKQSSNAGRGRGPASRTRKAQAPDPPYHHGDLRRALLDATEELLETDGLESFTLREVARRAGVSHGAPAHHFGDARGLLSEFTAQSFAEMAALMGRHRERAKPYPFEQLVAVGIAYVEYALENRARFQLMFRSDRLDSSHRSLAEAGPSAYGHLVDCITRIAQEIGAPDYAVPEKTALAWSLVHGYATLLIDNERFAAQMEAAHTERVLGMFRALLQLSRPAFEATGRTDPMNGEPRSRAK